MEINNFNQWIDTLSGALNKAEEMGVSGTTLQQSVVKLGDLLAQNVNPDVPENKFLKDLWQISDEQEKGILANMMVKYVNQKRA